MINQVLDVTAEFNANDAVVLDLSLWETVTVQAVNPSGTIDITATNDAGAVTGETDGGAADAANFTTVQATKLADGTAVTAIAAAGLYKLTVAWKFLKIGGASAEADKLLIFCTKPF